MGSQISPMKIVLSVLLVLAIARYGSSREISDIGFPVGDRATGEGSLVTDQDQRNINHVHDHHRTSSQMDPADDDDPTLHVFFTLEEMKVGNSMPIYFPFNDDPSNSPRLLSRQEADSIPFSSSQLPFLLELFSFSEDSPQAKAVKRTLYMCELEPFQGENRLCATSLESMLDFVGDTFGPENSFKALTTNFLTKQTSQYLNYTVLEEPKEVLAPVKIGCHTFPYPYVVYFCHTHGEGNKIFEILLGAENGVKVQALTICHMDTSKWDEKHISFRALKIKPGTHHVCHFFPEDNLIWIPSSD